MDVSRATRFVHSLLVPVRLEHRLGLSRNLKGMSVGIPFQASGFDPRPWEHPRRNGLGPGEVNIVRVNRPGMRFDGNAQWLQCEAWRERSGAHQRTFARRGRGMDASTSLHTSCATFLVRKRGRIAPAVPSFTLLPFTTQFTTFRGRCEHRNPVPSIRGCLIGRSGSRLLSIGGSIGKRFPSILRKKQSDPSRMAARQLRPPCRFVPGPAKHCVRIKRNASRKCKVEDGEDALPQFPINVGMYHLVHKVTLEDRDANNAFVSFCCDLARKEGVERTLNVLRHPYGMDPCVAMLCLWMPIAGMEQPLGELQVAQIGKISNRWSGRLQRTLENARCQLEGESAGGEDSEQLRAEIGLLESKVILAEQRHLHETVKAAAFWSPGGSQETMDPLSDSPWKVTAQNLRIYLRYMGLPHTPQIIRHIVDLNVACFDENFDQTEFVHTFSPNNVRPRTLEQDKKMFRYHMAKEAHKEAWEAYKEAQKELRRTRRISSIARHELYRTRKEVRQVWR